MALRKEKGDENGFSSPFYAFLSAMRFSPPVSSPSISLWVSPRIPQSISPASRYCLIFAPLRGILEISIVESEIQQWMRMFWYCADVCY